MAETLAPTTTRKWAARGDCKVCGQPCEQRGLRTFCSHACQAKWRYHGGFPEVRPCDFCGADFRPKGKAKFDLRWCTDCLQTSAVQRYRRYAVTPTRYQAAMEAGCSVCGRRVDVLHVDHNHDCCSGSKLTCGKCVRGFLCGPCNRGIGLFQDDPIALMRAADYLLRGDDLSPR